MADTDLQALEPWIDGYLLKLEPGERTKVARKIGAMLRKANSQRIAANVQPDGTAMAARKPKKGRKAKLSARRGKMFPKVKLLRNMRVRPTADDVTVDFSQLVAGVAAVHHFGLVDKVDHRKANSISVRYPARRLLGFGPGDREAIMDEVLKWVGD